MYCPALRNDILTAAYEDLRPAIFEITGRFAWRYRFHFDDLLSESHRIFVREFERWHASDRKDKAALSSWIYGKVTWGLMSFVRKEIKHHNLPNADDFDTRSEDPNLFLFELRSELSADANAIVSLVLNAPADLMALLKWNKPTSRTAVIQSIREHLEDSGWQREEVKRYMAEISAVLNGEPREENPDQLSFWDDTPAPLQRCGFVSRDEVRALLSR